MHFGFLCIFLRFILFFTSCSIYLSILFLKIFLPFQGYTKVIHPKYSKHWPYISKYSSKSENTVHFYSISFSFQFKSNCCSLKCCRVMTITWFSTPPGHKKLLFNFYFFLHIQLHFQPFSGLHLHICSFTITDTK